MKKNNQYRNRITLLTAMSSLMFVALHCVVFAYAYFNQYITKTVDTTLNVDILFGHLNSPENPDADWGTSDNPYLISNLNHLRNLAVLQNTENRDLVNQNTVFQVSDSDGDPIFVGSPDYNNLAPIVSIGTENFPFVSTLRGVKRKPGGDYATLPTGEISDTSAIGNLRVSAKPNQFDIGLFGNVGPTSEEAADLLPGETIGSISTLLLYNIQVTSSEIGVHDVNHRHFVSNPTYNSLYETNHIGILVGHAQYTDISDISVYYSGENDSAHVSAFDVDAGSNAKYATSGGIVGFFSNIVVDEQTEYPVSSDGSPQNIGTGAVGLDLGLVYTEDLWTFMEEKTSVGNPAPLDSYDLKATFGPELYGENNTDKKYFQMGVFTFAHSKEVRGNDRITKLWSTSGSNMWTISTNNTYTSADVNRGTAKKYVVTQVTSAHVIPSGNNAGSTIYHTLNSTTFPVADYRFMIVYSGANNTQYALTRYGATAIAQKVYQGTIDTFTNFTIPEDQLKYYTFEDLSNRGPNPAYPPYESGWAYKYDTPAYMTFSRVANLPRMQYLAYGTEVTKVINSNNVIVEAPRPLRIFYKLVDADLPTTSFMATSSTNVLEGVRIIPEGTGNLWGKNTRERDKTPYSQFKLQRMNSTTSYQSWYTTFNESTGFSATDNLSAGTSFKIFAVRITNNTSKPSENPTTVNLTKKVYTPTGTTKTYDMSLNTLYYRGTPSSSNPSLKYQYDMQTVESLDWGKNDGSVVTEIKEALKMADPTSYYYVNNRFWGVTQNIPAPEGATGTINVPEGSIGFTVNGTRVEGSKAKIFIIAASDPSLYIDQTITISRFGQEFTESEEGDRDEIGSFVLPPAPGATTASTQPIYLNDLTDNGADYTAYPNFNVLPVAFDIEVDAEFTTTYFLEASRGSATFIYLSAERTAAHDNNPTHENNVRFPHLSSVDYVFKGLINPNQIATVGSAEYVQSLTSPYFGLKANPDNPRGTNKLIDALIVPTTTGFNFTYAIKRYYDPVEGKNTIYIEIGANVDGSGYDPPNDIAQVNMIMANMNFNYSEWSYLAGTAYVYSDLVIININGYTISDWSLIT